MSRWWLAVGLAAVLAAGPAAAQDKPAESPKQLLDEAGDKFMRALELLLMAIPQYEAPVILPNGDIIIRRKNPEEPKKPEAPPAPPKDKTDRT